MLRQCRKLSQKYLLGTSASNIRMRSNVLTTSAFLFAQTRNKGHTEMMNTLLCHRMLLVRLLASYELNVGALTTRVLTLIGQILKSDLDPDQSRTQLLPTAQTRAKSGYKIRPTTT